MDPSYNNNFGAKSSPNATPAGMPNGAQNLAPNGVQNSVPNGARNSMQNPSMPNKMQNPVLNPYASNNMGAMPSNVSQRVPVSNRPNNMPGNVPNSFNAMPGNPAINQNQSVAPHPMATLQNTMPSGPTNMSSDAFGRTPAASNFLNNAPNNPSNSMPMAPIGSSSDIVINGKTAEKKSKKWLILAIALVALTIIGVLAVVLTNSSEGGLISQEKDSKSIYNSYVNYILLGEDSDADVSEDMLFEQSPYYYSLEGNQITEYVEIANQKYENLKGKYEEDEYLPILKSTYQDLAKIESIELEEMVETYSNKNGGRTAVEKLINERYATDSQEEYLNEYLAAEKTLAETLLNEVENANAMQCIADGVLIDGCYVATEDEQVAIDTAESDVSTTWHVLNNLAFDKLLDIYAELYVDENAETEETEDEDTEDEDTEDE